MGYISELRKYVGHSPIMVTAVTLLYKIIIKDFIIKNSNKGEK